MRSRLVTEVIVYQTERAKQPFTEWRTRLGLEERATVDARIERVKQGLMGDCKSVGDGVFELRIHVGPGFRVYFAWVDNKMVLLLCGGCKSTQTKDIGKAKEYLENYKERTK